MKFLRNAIFKVFPMRQRLPLHCHSERSEESLLRCHSERSVDVISSSLAFVPRRGNLVSLSFRERFFVTLFLRMTNWRCSSEWQNTLFLRMTNQPCSVILNVVKNLAFLSFRERSFVAFGSLRMTKWPRSVILNASTSSAQAP